MADNETHNQGRSPGGQTRDDETTSPEVNQWTPYATALAVYDYYRDRQDASRRMSRASEVFLLALSAAVTIAGVLNPDDSRVPSILGALAVAVTGLRATFHWRDDWIRFGMSRMSLRWELRRYDSDLPPYSDADGKALDTAAKDRKLVERLQEIEMSDTSTWASLDQAGAAQRPA